MTAKFSWVLDKFFYQEEELLRIWFYVAVKVSEFEMSFLKKQQR